MLGTSKYLHTQKPLKDPTPQLKYQYLHSVLPVLLNYMSLYFNSVPVNITKKLYYLHQITYG